MHVVLPYAASVSSQLLWVDWDIGIVQVFLLLFHIVTFAGLCDQ